MTGFGIFTVEGTISESLPNASFRVQVGDKSVLCHLAGRMRRSFIRLFPGDAVRCEINEIDQTKGRIIQKLK